MLGPAGTLVCLKGKRMFINDPSRGYYYPDHIALGREVSRARVALMGHYADRLFLNEAVYVGYSQGASMGALAVAEHGDWFPRLLLVEGGFDAWSAALAKQYAQTGGKRVLFVCGTDRCQKRARQSMFLLQRSGVATELRYAPGAGHRPDGPVADKVRDGLRWLLDDSPELSRVHSGLATSPATTQAPVNLASPVAGAM
jgi:predicted esterase